MDKTAYYTDAQCRALLKALYDGSSVALPVNEEHARAMIKVGQFYLNEQHKETVALLTKDYK